ncbi:MAG: hypothetical protein HY303_07900 [Candidatus Wallbacteria bacterium]|nr:hypothetical protein [Candidatus Wallbacteria bacterium]
MANEKWIGLSLGTDIDWPACFEAMMRRLAPSFGTGKGRFEVKVRRILMDPFFLTDPSKYVLVVDRLTHWFKFAREWLKKAALMNDVYLLNNPFTFQSMEKHSAFCAMERLGIKIPTTVLLPQKEYPKNSPAYAKTTARYNLLFDLDEIADKVGYPLYMKPYDGGGWRGVTRVADSAELHQAYDESGTEIMHLQRAVEPFDVFVRALAIGPQVMPMRYDATQPLHARYVVDHDFLSPKMGREVNILTKTINAFFRWEYNSCEAIVQDEALYPIDFANACPDSSLTSLHYYFPFVVKSQLLWTLFCVATGRKMRRDLDFEPWFAVGDDRDLDYSEKLSRYEKLADEYFETARFHAFCAKRFGDIDSVLLDFFASAEFDDILCEKVRDIFPAREHDEFIAHFRGLVRMGAEGMFAPKAPGRGPRAGS